MRTEHRRLASDRRTRAAENGEPSQLEDKQPHKQDDHNHETDGVDVIHDGRLIAVCKLIIWFNTKAPPAGQLGNAIAFCVVPAHVTLWQPSTEPCHGLKPPKMEDQRRQAAEKEAANRRATKGGWQCVPLSSHM
jgi:hypothetical protein